MTNDDLTIFSKRASELRTHITTEEATKMSLVAPFFQLLGYDIFNPGEFCPEYTADVGIKKGEKVDYAILINGKPVILIEVKPVGKNLDRHSSQLFRYYATTNARFAILTNGILYRFYTDLNEKNKMDASPFYEFDLLNLSLDDYEEIRRFSKDSFDENSLTDTAETLMYTNQFISYIEKQFQNPDDDFVRLFLKEYYSGVKTQNVIDKFRPVLKKALNDYVDSIVKERMTSLVNNSYIATTENYNKSLTPSKDELEFFSIIQKILSDLADVSDITYKKTESYFGVLYKNNVRKWLARITISSSQITLILPDMDKNENRYKLDSLWDTTIYKERIHSIFHLYTNTTPHFDLEKYLLTKWGVYEMPEPYSINLKHGERHDVKRVL